QDVDEVPDEVAVRVVTDRQVGGVLRQVDQQEQDDGDDAPHVLVAEDPKQRRPRRVAAHSATSCVLSTAVSSSSAAISCTMDSTVTSGPLAISAIFLRSFITMILSLRRTTSSSSDEMNTTETPPSANSRTRFWISALAPTSM